MTEISITPDWIKARLKKRGDQARLARAIGLNADKMSKTLKGERAIQADEVVRLLTHFGYTIVPPDGDLRALYAAWKELAKEERAFLTAAAEGLHAPPDPDRQ